MMKLLAAVVLAGASACATTTTVTTSLPHQKLYIDDHDHGAVDAEGKDIEIPAGFQPVAWQLTGEGDAVVAEGQIERSEPQWGVVAGAVAAAACCIPTAAAAGFCLANPALLAAPLTCLVVGPGAIVAACQAPGWFTVPLTCGGTALGASPLLLALWGQAPPPAVVLEKGPPPPPATTSSTPEQTEQTEQAW